jgi:hypothetical protein
MRRSVRLFDLPIAVLDAALEDDANVPMSASEGHALDRYFGAGAASLGDGSTEILDSQIDAPQRPFVLPQRRADSKACAARQPRDARPTQALVARRELQLVREPVSPRPADA